MARSIPRINTKAKLIYPVKIHDFRWSVKTQPYFAGDRGKRIVGIGTS